MRPAGLASAVYRGSVMHHRLTPPAHRFEYPLFMWLLDIDELPGLARTVRGFACNRPGAVVFDEADHFDGTRGSLVSQVRRLVEAAGVGWPGGPVRVLTHCRMLGYGFNPVSFWYCHTPDGGIGAVIAEVNNTFGERHCYVSRAGTPPASAAGDAMWLRWHDKKVFHVSPFFSLDGSYAFAMAPPAAHAHARIDLRVAGQPQLVTSLALSREPISSMTALRLLASYPFMTARIVGRIHWQALRLWRKGARYHRKPAYDPRSALETRS